MRFRPTLADLFAAHRLICSIFLLACLNSLAYAAKYPFSVVTEKLGNEFEVVAKNHGPAPVAVRIEPVTTSNLASDQSWPLLAVVRPNQETRLALIRAADNGQPLRFSLQITHRTGNFFATHHPSALYRLPYPDGKTYVVSQAPGGPIKTHNAPDSQYAIDFAMPDNSPLVAARDGMVIEIEDKNSVGGTDPAMFAMTNRIRILHDDETIATYSHLAHKGVFVQVGERVKAGTPIGLSGSTGYTSGPHLHFVVHELARQGDKLAYVSVPLRFYVGNPPYVFPAEHLHVLQADYTNPGRPPPFHKTKRASAEARSGE